MVNHSDIVGASPIGAAPTTSSFWTKHLASVDWTKATTRQDEKHLSFEIWCNLYERLDSNCICYRYSTAHSVQSVTVYTIKSLI